MAVGAMNGYETPLETETYLTWAFFRPFPSLSYGVHRAYRPRRSHPRRQ